MNKLKLKLLLIKYKNEISKGNNMHMKDLIATMVILDLICIDNIESININKITLNNLIYMFLGQNKEYEVPMMEKISLLKNKYKKEIKSRFMIPINFIWENAATTWLEMMIKFGMVKEGQIINPTQFILTDFMTDEKLISMFETNGISIRDCSSPFEKKLIK